jgi:hypothetical protein
VPVSVENCGVTVSVDQPIEKAVAVNQPAVELLLSLGLQDRMQAYAMSDDRVLPELTDALETVAAFDTEFPSFEAVIDDEPDFVYATFDYAFSSEGIADRDRFEEFGIATYQSPSECGGQDATQDAELSLEDLYSEIADIATLFGIPLSMLSLLTGILLGAGSKWGVLRHRWVAGKLLLLVSEIVVGAFVLGPATDGGYTLIGSRQPTPELFEVRMSTSQVLQETVARAHEAGHTPHLLAPRSDLDTVGDVLDALEAGWLDQAPRTRALADRLRRLDGYAAS